MTTTRMPFAACALALALLSGCGEENLEAAPSTEPDPVAEDDTPAPRFDNDRYELIAEPRGPYTAGEAAAFEIRLTPRGEYYVNQDFGTTVQLGGDGVTFPRAELSADDAAEFSEQLARFEVPFTPGAAGNHEVTAVVDFAVCTDTNCRPETRTLAVVLPVQ